MSESVQYEHWSEFLFRAGAACSPATLHGLLCGLLAGSASVDRDTWLEAAAEAIDLPGGLEGDTGEALDAMRELAAVSLKDEQLSFKPLLPDDALPLAVRTAALAEWCGGFLQGVAKADSGGSSQLGADTREGLEDLGEIAQLEQAPEESNTNEVYFTELSEYVRVVVLNLYALVHAQTPPESGETTQLH